MATFYASKTGEVSAREKEHSALVRELAGECMTLLETTEPCRLPVQEKSQFMVTASATR